MSRAVVATAYGGPEVLEIIDETLPPPAPGQVLVEVRAIGVNPFDAKSYSGMFGSDPANLPLRLGMEASGVVLAVGSDDSGGPSGVISVGDEVVAYPVDGAYATQLLASASSTLAKPANMPFEQAAGLLLAGATAIHLLTATSVGAGETVLVHAAAGGVGLIAVQVAVARGASAIGTASEPAHDLLRSFGAVPVTYGPGLADRVRAAAPDGVTAALDCVGTDEALEVSLELVADRSRIATIVNMAGAGKTGIKMLAGMSDSDAAIRASARLELLALAADGKIRVFVDRTFPLDEVRAAHEYVGAGHTKGKVILVP